MISVCMPGSFCTRIFPDRSLHLVVSAFTLHWLSQVPSEVVDPTSEAWSGGNVWLHPSRPQIAEAFVRQSQRDLAAFPRCRAEEMASGALLFLVTVTLSNDDEPFQLEQTVWDELVSEGVISAHERDTFNLPIYMFSADELRDAICPFSDEFQLLRMVTFDNWSGLPDEQIERVLKDAQLFANFRADFSASLTKPLLTRHSGSGRATLFVDRCRQVAARLGSSPARLYYDLSVIILRRGWD